MRKTVKLALISGSTLAMAVPALAGHSGAALCGPQGGPHCAPSVVVSTGPAHFDDMLVSVDQPMGHLRSVDYRRSPHVSITRIHGMGDTAELSDYPSGFTGGCHPESTQYCKAGSHTPAPIAAPLVAAPLPAPVHAPVYTAPRYVSPAPVFAPARVQAPVRPLRQWTASYNDDPARFTPRQYGSLDFVPGIAHVPSSWVDRDPNRAQSVLNATVGGTAPGPQTGLSRIPDATPGPMIPIGQFQGPAPVQPGSIVQPGPASHAPNMISPIRAVVPGQAPMMQMHTMHAPVMSQPVMSQPVMSQPVMAAPIAHAPMMQGYQGVAPSGTVIPNMPAVAPLRPGAPKITESGLYASPVAADGTYWEKTSGTTLFGSTIATQVICKRKLPTETVNPVVGVPTAVPYPVQCDPVQHVQHSRYSDGLAGGHHWTK